jgi:hypothetical protein
MRYVLPLIALIALAVACGGDIHAADWRLSSPPAESTLQIEVGVGNSCYSLQTVKVDEFEDLVKITAFVKYDDTNGCDDLFQIVPYTVQLKEPLAGRQLDGCDQDVGHRNLSNPCEGAK